MPRVFCFFPVAVAAVLSSFSSSSLELTVDHGFIHSSGLLTLVSFSTSSSSTACVHWCPPNPPCVNAEACLCAPGFSSASRKVFTGHLESCDGTEACGWWRVIQRLWGVVGGHSKPSTLKAAQKHFAKDQREGTTQGSVKEIGSQVFTVNGRVLGAYTVALGYVDLKSSSATDCLSNIHEIISPLLATVCLSINWG